MCMYVDMCGRVVIKKCHARTHSVRHSQHLVYLLVSRAHDRVCVGYWAGYGYMFMQCQGVLLDLITGSQVLWKCRRRIRVRGTDQASVAGVCWRLKSQRSCGCLTYNLLEFKTSLYTVCVVLACISTLSI